MWSQLKFTQLRDILSTRACATLPTGSDCLIGDQHSAQAALLCIQRQTLSQITAGQGTAYHIARRAAYVSLTCDRRAFFSELRTQALRRI